MRPLGAIFWAPTSIGTAVAKGLLVTLALMAHRDALDCACAWIRAIGVLAPLHRARRPAGPGILGWRRGRRRVRLSRGDRDARAQGILRRVAVGEPAAGGGVRRLDGPADLVSSPAQMLIVAGVFRLFIGCVLIPFVFLHPALAARRPMNFGLDDTGPPAEMLRSSGENWRIVLLGMLMVMMTTVSFYLLTAYTPTYGHSCSSACRRATSFLVTLCVG